MAARRSKRPDLEPHLREELDAVRRALLKLHKALFDAERIRYEQVNGRVETTGELFNLVIKDPWFAWLRPLSGLIVQMDEILEGEETPTTAEALLAEARRLLLPDEQGGEFQREYHRSLQQAPEVGLIHGEWKRLLPKKKEKDNTERGA